MASRQFKLCFVFLLVIIFIFLVSVSFVSGTACWQYTSNASGQCTSSNGCIWKVDPWGSWCEELNCWSFSTQSSCTTGNVPGKNCTWQGGSTNNYCTQLSCYQWAGTNQTACENNTASLSCQWSGNCYSSGQGGSNCWNINVEATCVNTTGCKWGDCMQKNCYDYTSSGQSTCIDKKDWSGTNCTWVNVTGNTFTCETNSCWSSLLYPNQTSCDTATNCQWQGSAQTGWCKEVSCIDFDGNQSGCVNANVTNNIDCVWSNGYCQWDSCYTSTDSTSCASKESCSWTSTTTSGWCNEVNCWTWDSYNGGSELACSGNASLYGLSCNWVNYSTNNGTGWCEKDNSAVNCTTYTNEGECYGSWFCWWQAKDWNNPNLGGNCTAPNWGSGDVSDNDSILNNWNPGCYIFDTNQTECGNVIGCDNSTAGSCELNQSHPYNLSIGANGLNCTIINVSGLCNDIAALSSCCAWQSGMCVSTDFDASCWSDLTVTPSGEDSCDDASSKANCDILAGTPWYWPCTWDNKTVPAKCTAKTADIWGNNTPTLVTVENKATCEVLGGRWVTESYCVGNVSVPTGRCEYKFDSETNCNKACFACEYQSDGGPHANADDARESCYGSALGYCEFTFSTSAANGFGTCRAKTEFTTGVAVGCSASNCG